MRDYIFEASLHSNQIRILFKVMLCLMSFVTFGTFLLEDAARLYILRHFFRKRAIVCFKSVLFQS